MKDLVAQSCDYKEQSANLLLHFENTGGYDILTNVAFWIVDLVQLSRSIKSAEQRTMREVSHKVSSDSRKSSPPSKPSKKSKSASKKKTKKSKDKEKEKDSNSSGTSSGMNCVCVCVLHFIDVFKHFWRLCAVICHCGLRCHVMNGIQLGKFYIQRINPTTLLISNSQKRFTPIGAIKKHACSEGVSPKKHSNRNCQQNLLQSSFTSFMLVTVTSAVP